ncbi:hypothetical protein V8F33_012310 [Rhypophila sp. PSN 637]
MSEDSKFDYASLGTEHDDRSSTSEDGATFIIAKNPERTRRTRWIILLSIFELVQLLAFFLVLHLRHPTKDSWPRPAPDVDGYSDLTIYNTTVIFSNDNHMVQPSELADHFWSTFMPGMPPSINLLVRRANSFSGRGPQKRGREGSGYPGVGHFAHKPARDAIPSRRLPRPPLLWRLRRILTGVDTHPKYAHTLHCLNYIRQTLMCNLDFTLGTTTNYEEYGLTDRRTCRDYEAIVAWIKRHNWKDLDAYEAMLVEHSRAAKAAAAKGSGEEGGKPPYV